MVDMTAAGWSKGSHPTRGDQQETHENEDSSQNPGIAGKITSSPGDSWNLIPRQLASLLGFAAC